MKILLNEISRLIDNKYSRDISIYNESFIEKTLKNRFLMIDIRKEKDYLKYLEQHPEEPELLLESFSNTYSEFFRNSVTFALIEQFVVPKLFGSENETGINEKRIWSAGCAGGQEAYSLAFLMDDFLSLNSKDFSFRIFATDKSNEELEKARAGIYDFISLRNSKAGLIKKYLFEKEGMFTIIDKIRNYIEFSWYDLLDDSSGSPPSSIYGGFDLISCCNLLFYYNPEIQKSILNKFSKSLNRGGFFITGEAEIAIVKTMKNFRQYLPWTSIFIKIN